MLFTILVVIAFVIYMHHSTSNVPLPQTAVAQGATLVVPVSMQLAQTPNEYWRLAKKSNADIYFVSVVNKGKMIRTFETVKRLASTSGETSYTLAGQIEFNGVPYQLTLLRLGATGTSGSIVFTRTGLPVSQSNTNGQAPVVGGNTSGS